MEKELTISGMSCHHCVHGVRNALARVPGLDVKDVRIGGATVEVKTGRLDEKAVRDALDEEGYELKTVS